LVLGLAGSVAGCGPAAKYGSPADEEARGKAIAEGNRKYHEQLKASKKAEDAAKNASRGEFRPPR
jgi:hypothetical protein